MNQPELGKKISEIRNQKGITQKELSETCNIDIRTIQRIESGEVYPRSSTIKLIAEALETDPQELNGNDQNGTGNRKSLRIQLFITWIAGIIYLTDWIFYAPLLPKYSFNPLLHWILSIINVVTCVFLYYGFYLIGNNYKNGLLKFASVFFMIIGPVYFLLTIVTDVLYINPEGYIDKLFLSLLGINCLFFGIGLLKNHSRRQALYKSTGILQLVVAPFFILPLTFLYVVGCWINIPLYILMLSIMFLEYRSLNRMD